MSRGGPTQPVCQPLSRPGVAPQRSSHQSSHAVALPAALAYLSTSLVPSSAGVDAWNMRSGVLRRACAIMEFRRARARVVAGHCWPAPCSSMPLPCSLGTPGCRAGKGGACEWGQRGPGQRSGLSGRCRIRGAEELSRQSTLPQAVLVAPAQLNATGQAHQQQDHRNQQGSRRTRSSRRRPAWLCHRRRQKQ
mgnify:CR=1 FL=1